MGTFPTATIAANGQAVLAVTDIEKGAGITPNGVYHYVIKLEGAFTGFLQHYVASQTAGAVSARTRTCCTRARPR